MGYDVLVVALMVLSIALAILFIVARDRARRSDEASVSRAWSLYAKERGFAFVAAEGEWPNRSVPRLVSEDVEILLVREGERVLTRLERRPREAMLGRLLVTTGAEDAGALPKVEAPSAHAFHPSLSVFAKPASIATALLTREVARAVEGFRMGGALHFEYARGRIVLEWGEGERNAARLDEARNVAELACHAMEAAFVAAAVRASTASPGSGA